MRHPAVGDSFGAMVRAAAAEHPAVAPRPPVTVHGGRARQNGARAAMSD
jgi:hypothetical protein